VIKDETIGSKVDIAAKHEFRRGDNDIATNLGHAEPEMGQEPITAARICAVVVTFFPDCELSDRLKCIRGSVGGLLIVDNTDSVELPKALDVLKSWANTGIIRNASNLGIGRAVNDGLREAARRGFKWAVLLDQDSAPGPRLIDALCDAFSRRWQKQIAVATPRVRDSESGLASRPAGVEGSSGGWHLVKTAQTSGSFVNIDTFFYIGGYREDYFIDEVDHEFCLRAGLNGYAIAQSEEILMTHSLGKITKHRFCWATYHTNNHTAVRHYYMARNLVFLFKTYLLSETRWLLVQLFTKLKVWTKVALFENGSCAKLYMVCRGVVDGLCGRRGPIGLK
jgi:rhamnosyltransferase